MRKTSQMNSRNPKKFKLTPAKFIVGTLMTLFVITGCSDMPYIGSTLTVHEVDRYLVSTDGNAVCFQDDLDSTCIKLGPETASGADATNGPAIHIYPEKRLYLFYHEGNPIFRAERVDSNNNNNNGNGDNDGNNGSPPNNGNPGNNGTDPTTDPPAGGPSTPNTQDTNNNNPPTDPTVGPPLGGPSTPNAQDTNNDNADDGHGWIIWVYYPEGTVVQNALTLSESGVTVTINGKQLTDADITGFAQFIGPNNEAGVQFFYETKSAELLDLKIRMEGVAIADDPVKFNINYLWHAQ